MIAQQVVHGTPPMDAEFADLAAQAGEAPWKSITMPFSRPEVEPPWSPVFLTKAGAIGRRPGTAAAVVSTTNHPSTSKGLLKITL